MFLKSQSVETHRSIFSGGSKPSSSAKSRAVRQITKNLSHRNSSLKNANAAMTPPVNTRALSAAGRCVHMWKRANALA